MSARVVSAVVGGAFVLAGLLILLLPIEARSPGGIAVACGNAWGAGFDDVALEAQGVALPEVCARLRERRYGWGLPVVVFGLAVGAGTFFVNGRVARRGKPAGDAEDR
ncbi:hypothetical protein GCM10022243_46890 [Saccharothrix violaceirubra]|uniref:Uncharacterized protein n=1 Tax=Saccharothrix violaceirubra TaxID=413306 RepID=A0A7W7T9N1_9PSEU|nr:hypothetical protein [Saccharothrix violaceirubra]MBB4967770.1 hypothetical protein [Saccharothrix violaceirubra]